MRLKLYQFSPTDQGDRGFLDVEAKYMLEKNKNLWSPHHEIPRLIQQNGNFTSGKLPPLKVGFLSSDFESILCRH